MYFGVVVVVIVLVVTGEKQSQLLVPRLGLEFDKREKNGENSGSLTLLPVGRLNGDRLQRRPLVPISCFLSSI